MLYFVCPDVDQGSGGVKQLYRHVDVLNTNGINARILHKEKGFRCAWFPNTTKITSRSEVEFTNKDIIVLPEVHGALLAKVFPGVPKVIFNQGCFSTFSKFPMYAALPANPYAHSDLVGVIVASEVGERYMRFVFPDVQVERITIGIDAKTFTPGKKKRQICFMPRKLKEDARQIINILRLRGRDVPIKIIENMSEDEVAHVLAESLIFLSFNFREGFGLPPVEAMCAGCVVVGYAGGGGKEYFHNEFTNLVPDGDIIEFVTQIESVLDDSAAEQRGLAASAWAREQYSLEKEEKSIVAAWKRLMR